MKQPGPINSRGKPWLPGDVWHCLECGETGDDRDDIQHSSCPGGRGRNPPHRLEFTTAGVKWSPQWAQA